MSQNPTAATFTTNLLSAAPVPPTSVMWGTRSVLLREESAAADNPHRAGSELRILPWYRDGGSIPLCYRNGGSILPWYRDGGSIPLCYRDGGSILMGAAPFRSTTKSRWSKPCLLHPTSLAPHNTQWLPD